MILSSCAHKIPDVPACIELDPQNGYCTKTISNEESFPTGDAWANIKLYSLIVPLESWAEIKKFILDICQDYGKCTEAQDKVDQIDGRLP